MARHKFSYLLEYIPVRYQGLNSEQLQARKDVFDFKDGSTPISVKTGLLSKIRNMIYGDASQWVVCFIPASTRAKTFNRFSSLALYLSREAGCNVYIDAVTNSVDSVAGHISGKSNDPTKNFEINSNYIRGKKVIIIDDVITRGKTFDDTADKLIRSGALAVQGLFVAKTIHPNLPQVPRGSRSYDDSYDIFEDMYEEEMAAELASEMAYEEEMMEEMAAEFAEEECYDEYDSDFGEYYEPEDFY